MSFCIAVNNINHPFHLHGYELFVMGMGQHPDKIPMTVALAKQMSKNKSLNVSPNARKPVKDTISIPSKGYTVFRFKADNPGWWLLHCHYCKHWNSFLRSKWIKNVVFSAWHMAVGMGLVLQVGEQHEMVKPPADFPKCGNYQPSIEKILKNH